MKRDHILLTKCRERCFLENNGWRNVVDARAWAFREGESRLPTSFLFTSFYLSYSTMLSRHVFVTDGDAGKRSRHLFRVVLVRRWNRTRKSFNLFGQRKRRDSTCSTKNANGRRRFLVLGHVERPKWRNLNWLPSRCWISSINPPHLSFMSRKNSVSVESVNFTIRNTTILEDAFVCVCLWVNVDLPALNARSLGISLINHCCDVSIWSQRGTMLEIWTNEDFT